jgi:hypothetical protein
MYKCNARNAPYQVVRGNWAEVFASPEPVEWGSTEWVPALNDARVGDLVLAYQTDRNHLAGVAKVHAWKRRGKFRDLILRPLERIEARVRPLKQADPAIAKIPALQPGPIRTLYKVSQADANRLLRAARASLQADPSEAQMRATAAQHGAGFGTADENRKIEQAAITFVARHFRKKTWRVQNVSSENLGYDLVCKRSRHEMHLEVKGCKGSRVQFILTENERRVWASDHQFVLALVAEALSTAPILYLFPGPGSLLRFSLTPVSHVAVLRTNALH